MTDGKPREGIKITLDDLAQVDVAERAHQPIQPASSARSYGTITEAAGQAPAVELERGSIFLKGWFYLGAAGLVGALVGWAICEPGFVDGARSGHWGNVILVPVTVAIMTLRFARRRKPGRTLSEESSPIRTALSLPLGLLLGFIFYFLANIVFGVTVGIVAEMGVQSSRNPAFWIARAIAWTVFAVPPVDWFTADCRAVLQEGKSSECFGGVFGVPASAAFSSTQFPWGQEARSAALSRAVGFAIFGLATGAMMGVVESALKDRWLYVTSGPLAGKQFILYKPQDLHRKRSAIRYLPVQRPCHPARPRNSHREWVADDAARQWARVCLRLSSLQPCSGR